MDTLYGVWLDYTWLYINRIVCLFLGITLVSPTRVYAWRHRCVNFRDDGQSLIRPYGRALRVSNAMAIGFVLINVAALLRVLLPLALPDWYNLLIYGSTLSWLAAFSLFMFVYAPILNSTRIDGQEG